MGAIQSAFSRLRPRTSFVSGRPAQATLNVIIASSIRLALPSEASLTPMFAPSLALAEAAWRSDPTLPEGSVDRCRQRCGVTSSGRQLGLAFEEDRVSARLKLMESRVQGIDPGSGTRREDLKGLSDRPCEAVANRLDTHRVKVAGV